MKPSERTLPRPPFIAKCSGPAPRHSVTARLRDPASLAWLCLAVGIGFIILAVIGAFAVGSALRTSTLAQASRNLDQLSGATAEQITRSLQAVDLLLQDIGHQVEDEAVRRDIPIADVIRSGEVHDLLVKDVGNLGQLAAAGLITRDGDVANWSEAGRSEPLTVADRSVVATFAADGDGQDLLVSLPQGSREPGRAALLVSRRLTAGPGAAEGAAIGVMPIQLIDRSFAEIARAPGLAVTLKLDDGLIVARAPGEEVRFGDVDSATAYKGRLASTRAIPLYGMTLVVSVTKAKALSLWRKQAVAIVSLTATASACVTLLMVALLQQIRAQRAVQRQLLEQNRALEELNQHAERQTRELAATADALHVNEALLADRSSTLTTTLQYIDQGILMVDAEGVVVVYNQRARDILGLPSELLAIRPKFKDLMAYQWAHGEFDRASQSLVDFLRTSGGMVTSPHYYQRERPNGQVIEIHSLPLPGGGMVRTFSDITDRKRAEARIERAALVDELTGLPNRISLRRHLDDRLHAGADGVALLYINLDRFRLLNDARGHVTGDALLQAVAVRLAESVPTDDLLSRTGGDEFALAHHITTAQDNSSEQAATLLRLLSEPYVIDGKRMTITASIGVATAAAGTTTDILLRNADIAMYRAKDGGRNQLCRYEPAMATEQLERFHLEQSLREALGTPALRLAYQPIVSLDTNMIAGFEALLRWHDPVRGEVPPAAFIPIAEATGLIVPLGRSALAWACHEAAGWANPRTVAVNLSPAQFLGDDLIELVQDVLAGSRLDPSRLELEVTEGMLLQDTGTVRETMFALRDLGVSLTLDDFGTGHAGLSYLQRFPFQKFKIDRSFVRNLGRSREADTIVEEMLLLARRLDLRVVAEGVELEAQLERLRQLGCPYVQGYLTGRPANVEIARVL